VGRFALYRDEARPVPRAEVALEPGHVSVFLPGGGTRVVGLDGAAAATADAASRRRFVRMLVVESPGAPELVAITPRALRLPEAPADAVVLEADAFDALADWLMTGGRLTGCSIAELARLSRIASPHFATLIGEVAAQIAVEMVWEATGPLRGGADLDHALRPLHEASRTSVRAAEALVAALSIAAVLRPRRRRRVG
jgi:hypothetical protein